MRYALTWPPSVGADQLKDTEPPDWAALKL